MMVLRNIISRRYVEGNFPVGFFHTFNIRTPLFICRQIHIRHQPNLSIYMYRNFSMPQLSHYFTFIWDVYHPRNALIRCHKSVPFSVLLYLLDSFQNYCSKDNWPFLISAWKQKNDCIKGYTEFEYCIHGISRNSLSYLFNCLMRRIVHTVHISRKYL